jgi:hypothetical protein
MGDRELHVVGKRLFLFGKLVDDHFEHVMKCVLSLLGSLPHRMASFNGGNVGNVSSVVITPANDLIIEERLHRERLYDTAAQSKSDYRLATG